MYKRQLLSLPEGLPDIRFGFIGVGALVGLILGILLAPWCIKGSLWLVAWIELWLQKTPPQDLIMGSIGLVLGLIIANLLGSLLAFWGLIGKILWALITVLLAYLGLSVGVKKREEILGWFETIFRFGKDKSCLLYTSRN